MKFFLQSTEPQPNKELRSEKKILHNLHLTSLQPLNPSFPFFPSFSPAINHSTPFSPHLHTHPELITNINQRFIPKKHEEISISRASYSVTISLHNAHLAG
jgi:hypothetical protein